MSRIDNKDHNHVLYGYNNHPSLPLLCNFQFCFFNNLITEYPLYSRGGNGNTSRAVHYHIPCAMVANII